MLQVSQADFESALYVTCSPEHLAIYWQFINERKEFIKNILKHYNTTHYRYRDLEWRLESRVYTDFSNLIFSIDYFFYLTDCIPMPFVACNANYYSQDVFRFRNY